MNRSILMAASVSLMLLAGCQILPEASSDPTRNYVLSGPAGSEPAAKSAGKYQIGIRAVEVPGYLHNHRDMAVRTASNEIKYDEFSRWAESLEDGVNRVLKQHWLSTDGIAGVSSFPFATDVKRDYDVVIRIQNCEGAVVDGRSVARFVATYDVIAAGAGGQAVVRRTFVAPDLPWNGKDFGALAGLLSDDVARLSEDIAANLPK